MRISLLVTALAGMAVCTACAAPTHPQQSSSRNTMTITAPANYTEHSYRGRPDLGLTLAIVEAGGGPTHFESGRLFKALGGHYRTSEASKLQKLYGKAKLAAFMQTFTYAVHDLIALFRINHIALPAQPRISPKDGRSLSVALYHAGIMPTGKYDCGYLMEHLMTHPIHIVLMHDINNAHGHGPNHNANFHLILTRIVVDLRNSYMSTGKTERRL